VPYKNVEKATLQSVFAFWNSDRPISAQSLAASVLMADVSSASRINRREYPSDLRDDLCCGVVSR
jgi:hypothetical protein